MLAESWNLSGVFPWTCFNWYSGKSRRNKKNIFNSSSLNACTKNGFLKYLKYIDHFFSLLKQIYIGTFSIGMGGIPWVIMSEVKHNSSLISSLKDCFSQLENTNIYKHNVRLQIFPIHIKGIGGSLVTITNWFGSWVVSYFFNFLMSWSSHGELLTLSAIMVPKLNRAFLKYLVKLTVYLVRLCSIFQEHSLSSQQCAH